MRGGAGRRLGTLNGETRSVVSALCHPLAAWSSTPHIFIHAFILRSETYYRSIIMCSSMHWHSQYAQTPGSAWHSGARSGVAAPGHARTHPTPIATTAAPAQITRSAPTAPTAMTAARANRYVTRRAPSCPAAPRPRTFPHGYEPLVPCADHRYQNRTGPMPIGARTHFGV